MAVRKAFSREDLEKAGKRSVSAAVEKLGKEIGAWVKDVDLVCRYFRFIRDIRKFTYILL